MIMVREVEAIMRQELVIERINDLVESWEGTSGWKWGGRKKLVDKNKRL